MNSILQLKGRFEQRSNRSRPGSPKLPKGKSVSASHLRELEKQLERILVYWTENKDIRGALVSVHYKHIVAKSNRLKILLSENHRQNQFEGPNLSGSQIKKEMKCKNMFLRILFPCRQLKNLLMF